MIEYLRYAPEGFWRKAVACSVGIVAILWVCAALARDIGQWENSNPAVKRWFETLMQPDSPTIPCCGSADAYWADGVEVKDGKVYAIITDDRPDEPLGRPHVPVGTKIEVPPNKLKYDRGNPLSDERPKRATRMVHKRAVAGAADRLDYAAVIAQLHNLKPARWRQAQCGRTSGIVAAADRGKQVCLDPFHHLARDLVHPG